MAKTIKAALGMILVFVLMSLGFAYLSGDLTNPAPAPVKPIAAASSPRKSLTMPLTAPLTRDNSYLHDFGDGKIIRVPNSINPGVEREPFEAQTISMTLWYPDMVQTGWPGHMTSIFEQQAGTYVEQRDRFRVYIKNLFYSPGDTGKPPGLDVMGHNRTLRMPNWRPSTMRRLRLVGKGKDAKGLIAQKSDYEGLSKLVEIGGDKVERARVDAIRRQNGWDGVSETNWYIEQAGSQYELKLRCSDTAGSLCEAYVYSSNSGFQYRMIYPSEAIANTDRLIRSINKMLDQWSKQTEEIEQ